MPIELKDSEVECIELAEDQSAKLSDLATLLPTLQAKYGKHAVLRFTGVAIAPTNSTRLRGNSYGNVKPQ